MQFQIHAGIFNTVDVHIQHNIFNYISYNTSGLDFQLSLCVLVGVQSSCSDCSFRLFFIICFVSQHIDTNDSMGHCGMLHF